MTVLVRRAEEAQLAPLAASLPRRERAFDRCQLRAVGGHRRALRDSAAEGQVVGGARPPPCRDPGIQIFEAIPDRASQADEERTAAGHAVLLESPRRQVAAFGSLAGVEQGLHHDYLGVAVPGTPAKVEVLWRRPADRSPRVSSAASFDIRPYHGVI